MGNWERLLEAPLKVQGTSSIRLPEQRKNNKTGPNIKESLKGTAVRPKKRGSHVRVHEGGAFSD